MSYKSKIVNLCQQYVSQLTCGLCADIYDDPVVLNCCGKSCCKSCIQELAAKSRTCPYDGRHHLKYIRFRRAHKELFETLNKLKAECVYQKYGCNQLLNKSDFESHLKTCPFITCETCELRIKFETEHNCVQELKDEIQNIQNESKRITDQNKSLIDKNILMSEMFIILNNKIKSFKKNNIKLENEIKISNNEIDIKNMFTEIIDTQNAILDANTQVNKSNITQDIFQFSIQFILSLFNIFKFTVIVEQNQRTRNEYKSLIERNRVLSEECIKLKTTNNKLNKEIEILETLEIKLQKLNKKENSNERVTTKLNLDQMIAINEISERKSKLDIIQKENHNLKSKFNNFKKEFETIKTKSRKKANTPTKLTTDWQTIITFTKLILLIFFPVIMLRIIEIVYLATIN